jgi:3-methylcrotonyl-CoA carboxylase alpha subunit
LNGHAIEARVCAEDPERDFLPSAGELRLLEWPSGEHVRVDAGFGTGDRVPENYDSLLGKVIAWAPARAEAASRLRAALQRTHSAGVRTNERWLARILASKPFLDVRHSIAFLEAHGQDLLHGRGQSQQAAAQESTLERQAVALAAFALNSVPVTDENTPWAARDGFTPNLPSTVQFTLQLRGQQRSIEIEALNGQSTTVRVDSVSIVVTQAARTNGCIAAILDGIRVQARVFVYESHVHIWLEGEHYDFLHEDPRSKQFSAAASSGDLTTPLPGVVAAVAVAAGQAVAAGDVLMVIEAMKMEHTITAPYAGTVQTVHFARGDRVPEGSTLLELEPQK